MYKQLEKVKEVFRTLNEKENKKNEIIKFWM